ncbi:MAG: restriction endonuclease subunit M [Candidatus Bathyarchaeia archaeon]
MHTLKETTSRDLATDVLKVFQVKDIKDATEALDIVITSLAAIFKSTGINSIATLTRMTDFAPLNSLQFLSDEKKSALEELILQKMKGLTINDIFENQIKVARLITPLRRKILAAYYTKLVGLKLMAYVVSQYVESHSRPLILADPFLGSGMTLSETIRAIPQLNLNKVWGIEPHPLSAMVAYAALVDSLKGEYQKVNVMVGDAFKIISTTQSLTQFMGSLQSKSLKADIILTNPPFTRWELLDKNYRTFLTNLVHEIGYDKYVKRKQQNLQLISLFLMDYLLERDGLLISVLPASTFYTLYGEAAKAMLKDKYWIQAIIEFGSEPSFSIDSGFKELILVASKRKPQLETAFLTIEAHDVERMEGLLTLFKGFKLTDNRVNWVDISKIPYPWDMNWLTLFGQNPLRELITKIFTETARSGIVVKWSDAFSEKHIVRGVEMYGPNFFLIPNKYWKIVNEDAKGVIIENNMGLRLHIDREFITPALRKPDLYSDSIIPKVQHYFLSIPPKSELELPPDIVRYIKWGLKSSTATPAVRTFGEYWYSHVNKQINVKKPFGRVFLPDKIDPSFSKRGVFACYTKNPITASKNFYIATFNDELKDKALALWFNSSLFIAYFIVASRKISERWTRFLEEDYLQMPVINVNLLDRYALQKLENRFDKMAERKLKPVKFQLGEEARREMDETLFEIIGVKNSATLRELYSLLQNFLC